MKKKHYILIGFLIILVIGGIILYKANNSKLSNDTNINYIEYAYGGGYGTMADTATKRIIIKSDLTVQFSNDYNNSTKIFKISSDKYNELCAYIIDNSSIFINKPKENMNVMDGGSSHIIVKTTDGQEYNVGGYMITDKKYTNMKTKIIDIAGKKRFNNYANSIK